MRYIKIIIIKSLQSLYLDWVSLKGIKTDMEAIQPYLVKIQPSVLFQIIDYHERKGANISEKEKSPK